MKVEVHLGLHNISFLLGTLLWYLLTFALGIFIGMTGLIKLPIFYENIGSNFYKELLAGLNITSYFFKNKLLLSINTNKAINLPKPRIRFVELIEKL